MIKLQSPIKPKSYDVDKGLIYITQLYGEMDLDYTLLGLKSHNGVDLRTIQFQDGHAPVLAAHSGTIISDKNTQSDTAGRFVKIMSEETTLEGRVCKIMTLYFHLKECRHEIGTKVVAGMDIGTADSTGGFLTGPHLHWGFYPYWKQADGTFQLEDIDGNKGARDPIPYMNDSQILQAGSGFFGRKFFYNGKLITRKEVNLLLPMQYR